MFLAICLLGASVVETVDVFSGFLGNFVAEGLVIIGWIRLWHPIDMLLFEPWPLHRERRVYQSLGHMRISVLPEPDLVQRAA